MPTFLLRRRAPALREHMDDPGCDRRMLDRTFAQFETLNRRIAGWNGIWRRHLRKALQRPGSSLLDIGCGGGDVIRHLAELARRDGLDVRFTGIDPDPRAIEYATSRPPEVNIRYCNDGSESLVADGCVYDAVISNHVLHHLDGLEFARFLSDSRTLSRSVVVHNDIRRDDLAPLLFQPARLLFRESFIVPDGIRSIRRSYTANELRRAAGDEWIVRRLFPYRLLLMCGVDDE
ncbi:MAG: methyltransferase domain-containing protein [Rhodothermales bacterium]|nr:methyltransferase domain-containing protein [Rhodothermales bacterium]